MSRSTLVKESSGHIVVDWRSGSIPVCCTGDGSCEINCKGRDYIVFLLISVLGGLCSCLNGTMVRSHSEHTHAHTFVLLFYFYRRLCFNRLHLGMCL